MNSRIIYQGVLYGMVMLLLISLASAIATSNTIAQSGVDELNYAITANDLKPSACNAIQIHHLIIASGIITGTNGNDLIIGSSGDDAIFGIAGNDCIIAGGGNDLINGGDGNDICLGGSGTDSFDASCETQRNE